MVECYCGNEFHVPTRPPTNHTQRVWFHTDSVMCGLSAIALKTNAPLVLQKEAMEYEMKGGAGATVLGGRKGQRCQPEKAVVANAAAVREWDSNGGIFWAQIFLELYWSHMFSLARKTFPPHPLSRIGKTPPSHILPPARETPAGKTVSLKHDWFVSKNVGRSALQVCQDLGSPGTNPNPSIGPLP